MSLKNLLDKLLKEGKIRKQETDINYLNGLINSARQNNKGEAGVVAIFADNLLQGRSPTIFEEGSQTRDYLYVEDAVNATFAALNYKNSGSDLPIFNVGAGLETSVNELYELMVKKTGKSIKPKYEEAKPGDLKRSCLDFKKAKKELKWQPKYDLNRGLEKTVGWFKLKLP